MKRTLLRVLVLIVGVLGALACSSNTEQQNEVEQQNEQPAPQVTLEDIVPAPGSALESVILMSDFEVACDDDTSYTKENNFLLINADDLEGSVEQNIEDLHRLRNNAKIIPGSVFAMLEGHISERLFNDLFNKPADTRCWFLSNRFDFHKRLENATWDSEPFKSFALDGTIVVNAEWINGEYELGIKFNVTLEPISP